MGPAWRADMGVIAVAGEVLEIQRPGTAVSLTARRAGAEQTLIFEPLDAG